LTMVHKLSSLLQHFGHKTKLHLSRPHLLNTYLASQPHFHHMLARTHHSPFLFHLMVKLGVKIAKTMKMIVVGLN
jgi:hypothetical protein